ncbi:MAG TPA: DUF3820 family protein [Planctomycetota bacterium]|nr:DUF3820 family protein [Planctomycetota bacterium]
MPFGKYAGMEMSSLPEDYLRWIVANFDPGPIRDEAQRILASPDLRLERESKSLEEQANELLGEKPVGFIRRGRGRPRKRF